MLPGVRCRYIKTGRIDLGSLRLKGEPVDHSRDRTKWADSYFGGPLGKIENTLAIMEMHLPISFGVLLPSFVKTLTF